MSAYHLYNSGASTKGYLKNNNTGDKLSFMFNPSSLSFSQGATYSEITSPGMSYPLTQYVRGNSHAFELPLYVYDRPSGDEIKVWESFLQRLIPPEINSAEYLQPDTVKVVLGTFIKDCVVENLNTEYTHFTPDLEPDEATFTLSLKVV